MYELIFDHTKMKTLPGIAAPLKFNIPIQLCDNYGNVLFSGLATTRAGLSNSVENNKELGVSEVKFHRNGKWRKCFTIDNRFWRKGNG